MYPHFDKLVYTFCIQNSGGIVLLILYGKCTQKFVEMRYTICIHFVYISHTSVVYILHNFCIQTVYTISVCGVYNVIQSLFSFIKNLYWWTPPLHWTLFSGTVGLSTNNKFVLERLHLFYILWKIFSN